MTETIPAPPCRAAAIRASQSCGGLEKSFGVSPMLRTCSRIIVLPLMLVALATAQAADATLTLACKGTETSKVGARTSSEVINIGIVVDFQKKTVVGLEPTVPLTIDFLAETTISFSGAETDWQMNGTLDRVTGSLVATSVRSNPNVMLLFDLQCRPTQRMF
jgi:hypothetical protein